MPGSGTQSNSSGLPLTTQQYAVAFIMMVATAYRFCDVDTFNLWGRELTHALAVTHIGWWDIVRNLIYGEVIPPGYRTVLYLFTQWFGVSEFVLRAPSVMAGIASVYLVFTLGHRCMSTTAGLLAATLFAGSSAAVFVSQEVSFSALFTFCVLASFYCFVEIFAPKPEAFVERALPLSATSNTFVGDFYFEWKAALSVRLALLAWFWFTTISVVYLHYTGWLVLASEIAVLVVWCRTGRSNCSRALIQCAFVPVMLAYLVWLPICYIHLGKAWPQLVFNVPDLGEIKQLVTRLFGIDPFMHILIAVGLLLSMVLPTGLRLMNVKTHDESAGSAGGMAMFVLMLLLMLLVYASTARLINAAPEFMTLLPFIILFSTMGAATVIDNFVPLRWRSALLALVILLLLAVQLFGQVRLFVFNDQRKTDIVSPLKLMMQDSAFMAGARRIFVSHEGVEYYLDVLNIRRKNRFFLDSKDPADVQKVANIVDDNVFYFVDVIIGGGVKDSSPVLEALSQKYRQLCISKFPAARLVKFNAGLPPATKFSDDECPDSTTDIGKPVGAIK